MPDLKTSSPDTSLPAPPTIERTEWKTTSATMPTHTAHDAELIAEFEELTSPRMPKVAQEVLHYASTDGGREALRMLSGDTPATAKQLEAARLHVSGLNDQLRLARRWRKPATHLIPRRRGPITLNGKLDDDGWRAATPLPIHFPVNQLEPASESKASVTLVWDDKHLFAGFRVHKPEIIAPVLPRNAPVCTFDCVEVFVLPQPRSRTYWEYNISPSGSIFEAYLCKHGDRPYSSRQPRCDMSGLEVAINTNPRSESDRADQGYIIELAIPWSELPDMDHPPKPGDVVYGLMAMSYMTGPRTSPRQTYFSHIPMLTSFHNIVCYSPFELADSHSA